MPKPLALLSALVLSACVSADGSVQSVQGVALQVALDDNYLWPVEMPGHPEVDVMPYIPALVVSRRDGAPLTEAEAAMARAAANAHCAALGSAAVGPSSRFAEGAWAFSPCG
jgi:hypothetical protein